MDDTILLLLVEDHPDTREVLTMLLSSRFKVLSCGSADEAIRILETIRLDVVMLDIGMAPRDGVQCLKMIRALPGYADVPAIALTGYARDVDRRLFLASGFQAVLTKPVLNEHQLVQAITNVARSRPQGTGRVLTAEGDVGMLDDGGDGRTSTPEPV